MSEGIKEQLGCDICRGLLYMPASPVAHMSRGAAKVLSSLSWWCGCSLGLERLKPVEALLKA